MKIYTNYILPKLTHWICSSKLIERQRKKVVPLAKGHVLEIGMGSGLNLPFYDTTKVEYLWGLEPSEHLRNLAEEQRRNVKFDIEFISQAVEEIPLDSNLADTVLVTYTLCTIPSVLPALNEMRRVLKPGGELIFCEHGIAPDEKVRRWQDRVNPIWKRLAGGCHLNRSIPSLIEQGGFQIKNMETMYIKGWKAAAFNYLGSAVLK
jgi:ubiquinone/menaquinone biosynthesis C-methylase UbiE